MNEISMPEKSEERPFLGNVHFGKVVKILFLSMMVWSLNQSMIVAEDHHQEMKAAEERWKDDDQGRAETWDEAEDDAYRYLIAVQVIFAAVLIWLIVVIIDWIMILMPEIRRDPK